MKNLKRKQRIYQDIREGKPISPEDQEYLDQCRANNRKNMIKYTGTHKEQIKAKQKEKGTEYARTWRAKNPEHVKQYMAEWRPKYREAHKEEIQAKHNEYIRNRREKDPEFAQTLRDYQAKYYREDLEKYREINRLKEKNASEQRRLKGNIASMIRKRIKNKVYGGGTKSELEGLPYTIEELMSHLEKLFQEGMVWYNYGKWEIDHIIPDCKFNYTAVEDQGFQDSWALSNLQPLWRKENQAKGSK